MCVCVCERERERERERNRIAKGKQRLNAEDFVVTGGATSLLKPHVRQFHGLSKCPEKEGK